jgi:hypothetical protein
VLEQDVDERVLAGELDVIEEVGFGVSVDERRLAERVRYVRRWTGPPVRDTRLCAS